MGDGTQVEKLVLLLKVLLHLCTQALSQSDPLPPTPFSLPCAALWWMSRWIAMSLRRLFRYFHIVGWLHMNIDRNAL